MSKKEVSTELTEKQMIKMLRKMNRDPLEYFPISMVTANELVESGEYRWADDKTLVVRKAKQYVQG